jgi:hypothetical protein
MPQTKTTCPEFPTKRKKEEKNYINRRTPTRM